MKFSIILIALVMFAVVFEATSARKHLRMSAKHMKKVRMMLNPKIILNEMEREGKELMPKGKALIMYDVPPPSTRR